MVIFNHLISHLELPHILAKIYWTGLTKSGCMGQYTNCFEEDTDVGQDFEIITNKGGGACVSVTSSSFGFTAKAFPCDTKMLLACEATKNTIPGETFKVIIFPFQHV